MFARISETSLIDAQVGFSKKDTSYRNNPLNISDIFTEHNKISGDPGCA
jgi:hypothetical protein